MLDNYGNKRRLRTYIILVAFLLQQWLRERVLCDVIRTLFFLPPGLSSSNFIHTSLQFLITSHAVYVVATFPMLLTTVHIGRIAFPRHYVRQLVLFERGYTKCSNAIYNKFTNIRQHNSYLLDHIDYMFRPVNRSSSGHQQNKSKVLLTR